MKKILFFLSIFICLLIIQGLLRSIIEMWQKKDLLIVTKKQLVKLKEENKKLKKQEVDIQDPAFLEQQARDKLFLVKQDEKIVLLPSNIGSAAAFVRQVSKPEIPVYEQWLNLIIGKSI